MKKKIRNTLFLIYLKFFFLSNYSHLLYKNNKIHRESIKTCYIQYQRRIYVINIIKLIKYKELLYLI